MKKYLICFLNILLLTTVNIQAEDCPNPQGWVPENLPELIWDHQIWATEVLPPDPNDPRRLNLCNADLSGFDFSEMPLPDAIFSKARIVGANFDKAILTRALFDRAYIKDSHFDGADLTRVSFVNTEIVKSRFAGALFQRALIFNTKFIEVDFTVANLMRVDFGNSLLQNVIMQDAQLYLANLKKISIGEERRDYIADFCRSLTSARGWQYSYRQPPFLCGARRLPGKYKMDGEE